MSDDAQALPEANGEQKPQKQTLSQIFAFAGSVVAAPFTNKFVGSATALSGIGLATYLELNGATVAAAPVAAGSATLFWHHALNEITESIEDGSLAKLIKERVPEKEQEKLLKLIETDFFKNNIELLLTLGASKLAGASNVGGPAISSMTSAALATYGLVKSSNAFSNRLDQIIERNNLPKWVAGPLAGMASSSPEIASSAIAASAGQAGYAVTNVSTSNISNPLIVSVLMLIFGKKALDAAGDAKKQAAIALGATIFNMGAIAVAATFGGPLTAFAAGALLIGIPLAAKHHEKIKNFFVKTIPDKVKESLKASRDGIASFWKSKEKIKMLGRGLSAVANLGIYLVSTPGKLFSQKTRAEISDAIPAFARDFTKAAENIWQPRMDKLGETISRNIMPVSGKLAALTLLVAFADQMVEQAIACGEGFGLSEAVVGGIGGLLTNAPEAAIATGYALKGDFQTAFASTISSNTVNVLMAGTPAFVLSPDGIPQDFSPVANPVKFALAAAAPAVATGMAAANLNSEDHPRLRAAATAGVSMASLGACMHYL
ncbi:MAG: hypothetical protein GC136_09335 [Alphaproteobacteria bacterium]|nr:hypothetical protein [Alphaproteobacteria bacterium]